MTKNQTNQHDDDFYTSLKKDEEFLAHDAKDKFNDVQMYVDHIQKEEFDLLNTKEKQKLALHNWKEYWEEIIKNHKDWWHEYIDFGYNTVFDENIPLNLNWYELNFESLLEDKFSEEEMQSLQLFYEKTSWDFSTNVYLDFLTSIELKDWFPRKLWSIMTLMSKDKMVSDSWKTFFSQKLELLDQDAYSHLSKVSIDDDKYNEIVNILEQGCTIDSFDKLASKMNEDRDVYNLDLSNNNVDAKWSYYLRFMVQMLPWSAEIQEEFSRAEFPMTDPLVIDTMVSHISALSEHNPMWASNSVFRDDTLRKLIIMLSLQNIDMDQVDQPVKILRENLYEWLKILPKEVDYQVLKKLFGELPALGDISWLSDVQLFSDTRNAIRGLLLEIEESKWLKNIWNRIFQWRLLEHKISIIASVFRKIKESINKGHSLELSIWKALQQQKSEDIWNSLGQKNFDTRQFLWDTCNRFNQVADDLEISLCERVKLTANDTWEQVSAFGDTRIEYKIWNASIPDLQILIEDVTKLWFNKFEYIKIPNSDHVITTEGLIDELIYQVVELQWNVISKEKWNEYFEYRTEIALHSLYADEKSILKTWAVDTMLSIPIGTDVGYVLDIVSNHILWWDEKFAAYNWSIELREKWWLTATKLNRSRFTDALIEKKYNRATSSDWLRKDFTIDKLDLLKERYKIVVPKGSVHAVWDEATVLKKRFLVEKSTYKASNKEINKSFSRHHDPQTNFKKRQYTEPTAMYLDLTDIDWKSIVSYLANLKEEPIGVAQKSVAIDWLNWLKSNQFDLEQEDFVIENKNVLRNDVLVNEGISQTPLLQAVACGNVWFTHDMNVITISWTADMKLYETVYRQLSEVLPNWEMQPFIMSQWRSFIEIAAELNDTNKVNSILVNILWLMWYGQSSGEIFTDADKKFGELLVEKNKDTQFTGLQTLAKHGHLEIVIRYMERYKISLRAYTTLDEAKEIMMKVVKNPDTSVETLKRFEWQRKQFEYAWKTVRYIDPWVDVFGKKIQEWSILFWWGNYGYSKDVPLYLTLFWEDSKKVDVYTWWKRNDISLPIVPDEDYVAYIKNISEKVPIWVKSIDIERKSVSPEILKQPSIVYCLWLHWDLDYVMLYMHRRIKLR